MTSVLQLIACDMFTRIAFGSMRVSERVSVQYPDGIQILDIQYEQAEICRFHTNPIFREKMKLSKFQYNVLCQRQWTFAGFA